MICLPYSVTLRGDTGSIFPADYNRGSKVHSLGVDEHAGTGYSLAFVGKNLHSSRWSVVFSRQEPNIPFLPSCLTVNERTNFKQRLYALKKYRLMTLNDRHNYKTSFTPSPAHTALKKAVKVAGIVVGLIVGSLLWAVLKPIFRGVGWIISILTAIAVIYWILTF